MDIRFDIALAHLGQRRRQSMVSIAGVALGVGFFIAIAAMMQGFQSYFVSQIIDVSPHVTMKDEFRTADAQPVERAYGEIVAMELRGLKPETEVRGIRNAKAILETIDAMEGVTAAPALEGQVFLTYGSAEEASSLIGIEPQRERFVTNLVKDLIAGNIESLETRANGIILGVGIADRLGATMSDWLTVTSPAGVVMRMQIVGMFETGVVSLDNGTSYTLLKKAQVLQDRINVIDRIRMRLRDVEQAEPIARHLESQFRYWTESWQEANSNVLGIFVIQNAIMYSTTGAILLVAAFGIYNIISTVVLEKTRDIAILKSLGFTEADIQLIFLLEGALVGAIGMLIGWGVGYGLTELLASIRFEIEGFVRTEGFVLLYSPWHYAIAGSAAFLSATLAAYLPARKAAALEPVDIIRGAA
ncbi:MAG: ABC transporter permease [Rhodospirillaceae bacterium]|nr:ABC transporter permease [Rhodospirillaceae bacterium]